jgi:hypothetical protein
MSSSRAYFLFAFVSVIALANGVYVITALGLGLCVFSGTDFLDKIGKGLPILEAMVFIACLQWILGPYFDYMTEYKHFKYYMYVPEQEYMNLVVPALLLFAIPIYVTSNKINYSFFLGRIQQAGISAKFSFNLIITGFLADVIGPFAPASLGFVFFLASGIKFIGLIGLFYHNNGRKWLVFFVLFAFHFLLAVRYGVFHTFLLWLVLTFLLIARFYPMTFLRKLMLLGVGFGCLFVLQTIKAEFRQEIWQNRFSGNKTELFFTLFFAKTESYFTGKEDNIPGLKDEGEVDEANNRLNQGWIISRIMSQIPSRRPYLQGETIENAIYSSLLPRFLVASKAGGGGGRLTYEKLTGFHLLSASMGTSVLGEAYGNYGVGGTYLFMFFWGLFLALLYAFIFSRAESIPLLPLWLPIIFLQAIKAETDLFTVLNHLVKSTVFVFGFIYIGKYVFRIRF